MLRVKVVRTFKVPAWNETTKEKAIGYWTRRRIIFSETSGDTLIGKRGNLVGNLTSFDMSKLMAHLTIKNSSDNEVSCVLVVNTVMQSVTDYNKAWWDLEMDTFESYLLRNDEQEEKWRKFGAAHKKAAWNWSLTFGINGNKIEPEDKL